MATLDELVDKLSERIGDYLQETVTTAITAGKNVVCANLCNYVNRDNVFYRYRLHILDKANAGAYRVVQSYTANTGTLEVLGADLLADGSDKATFQLHKYDRTNKIRAINRACRDTWPNLFVPTVDESVEVVNGQTEYDLPTAFQNPLAHVVRLSYVNANGENPQTIWHWQLIEDTERRILVPHIPAGHKLRIEGEVPLEGDLLEGTDEVSIQAPYIPLLIEYAAYALFDLEAGLPTASDRASYQQQAISYLASYNSLARRLKMRRLQPVQRIKGGDSVWVI